MLIQAANRLAPGANVKGAQRAAGGAHRGPLAPSPRSRAIWTRIIAGVPLPIRAIVASVTLSYLRAPETPVYFARAPVVEGEN